MNRRKSRLSLLICFGFIAFLFMASAYIALETDHDCTGEGCDICEQLARLHVLLQRSALLWFVFVPVLCLLQNKPDRRPLRRRCTDKFLSLVSLKVRMNN